MKAFIYGGRLFCGVCTKEMSMQRGGGTITVRCQSPDCPEGFNNYKLPVVELEPTREGRG